MGLLCRIILCGESDRHPISIGAVVVVGIAIVVDIAGIGRIAAIHRQEPPVGPEQNFQRITYIFISFFVSVSLHPSNSSAFPLLSASE